MMFYDGNMPVSQYEPPNCVSMRGVLGNVFFVILLGRPRSSYVNNGIEAISGFGIHCVARSGCRTSPEKIYSGYTAELLLRRDTPATMQAVQAIQAGRYG